MPEDESYHQERWGAGEKGERERQEGQSPGGTSRTLQFVSRAEGSRQQADSNHEDHQPEPERWQQLQGQQPSSRLAQRVAPSSLLL